LPTLKGFLPPWTHNLLIPRWAKLNFVVLMFGDIFTRIDG
jgi:hypothetical protein